MTLRHPLASALALGALLCPLSAQQDWVTWTSLDGTAQTDQFGTALTGVGDWNVDGYDDYAVSSVGSDRGLQNAGLVTIFSGVDDSVLAEVEGLVAADQLGWSLANLGSHDGDGLPKIAIGAPYASTASGAFSGVVRIYAWDNVAGSLSLVTELLGPAPGALFGSSLAAFELNGDGDLDLAVGAMGANFQDGEVSTFVMSDAGAATPASAVYPGDPGSMEMFGWALSASDTTTGSPGGSLGDDLVVGAPFADDAAPDAGAVVLIDEFGGQTVLVNPFGSVANGHLGYSVTGGQDVIGSGSQDLAAGAPDTTLGDVAIWNGATLAPVLQLPGGGAGSQFGYSVLMSPDANFDTRGDLAVGSPSALGGRGTFQVYSVAAGVTQLHSAAGPSGTDGRLGWSLGVIGDLNQTDKMELGAGSPYRDGLTGHVDIYSPPAQDIGPIDLVVSGPFDWETDVVMDASNLSPGGGGELYWYVGTQFTQSTSPEGYDLNIGGFLTLISIDANPGDVAQQVYRIEDSIPDGTRLYFQLVEDRNGFVRTSNVDSDIVNDPGVTLFVNGDTAGAPVRLQTRWGIPNSPVYIYGTAAGATQQPVNDAPNGSWQLNLINARFIGQPGDKSGGLGEPDEGEFLSNQINIPAGMSGSTVYFQAYDWDLFAPALTNVVVVTLL